CGGHGTACRTTTRGRCGRSSSLPWDNTRRRRCDRAGRPDNAAPWPPARGRPPPESAPSRATSPISTIPEAWRLRYLGFDQGRTVSGLTKPVKYTHMDCNRLKRVLANLDREL